MTDANTPQDDALAELLAFGRFALQEAQARIATAEDDETFTQLMQAGMRAARSLRQTLALHDRRAREARLAAKAERDLLSSQASQAIQQRKAEIRAHLTYEISREADGSEAEKLDADLEELLDIEAFDNAFLQTPIPHQIHRIAQDLGLNLPTLVAPPPGELSPQATEGVARGWRRSAAQPAGMTPSVAPGDSSPKRGATREEAEASPPTQSSA